jgi:hypothetical protein
VVVPGALEPLTETDVDALTAVAPLLGVGPCPSPLTADEQAETARTMATTAAIGAISRTGRRGAFTAVILPYRGGECHVAVGRSAPLGAGAALGSVRY